MDIFKHRIGWYFFPQCYCHKPITSLAYKWRKTTKTLKFAGAPVVWPLNALPFAGSLSKTYFWCTYLLSREIIRILFVNGSSSSLYMGYFRPRVGDPFSNFPQQIIIFVVTRKQERHNKNISALQNAHEKCNITSFDRSILRSKKVRKTEERWLRKRQEPVAQSVEKRKGAGFIFISFLEIEHVTFFFINIPQMHNASADCSEVFFRP